MLATSLDMAIDTPAHLAILGAGPMGLEAALYARFLGYDVTLFEQNVVAAAVRQWGHVRMFSPFRLNRSPLGLAALAAQDSSYRPPADEALLTGHEWIEQYLEPLAQTDLLADHLRLHTQVVAVGRPVRRKGDDPGSEARRDDPFRIVTRDAQGQEVAVYAHAVIDTTGVLGQPLWLGAGGLPALGESACRHQIASHSPDLLGRAQALYLNRRILVVGHNHAAAHTINALARLAQDAPATRVVWVTDQTPTDPAADPIPRIDHDPFPARDAAAAAANQLAQTTNDWLDYRPGRSIDAIQWDDQQQQFSLRFSDTDDQPWESFDRVVAHVGFRPDEQLGSELQLLHSPLDGTLLPFEIAPSLATGGSSQEVPLSSLEPDYYILGAKSYGRREDFLFSDGLGQIRRLFALLGDRPTLDLYSTTPR